VKWSGVGEVRMQRERKKWARAEKRRKKEGRTTNAVEENIPQQLQVDTVGNSPVFPL
jgi:hypothetical protein